MFWRSHRFSERLSLYLDGQLSDQERRALQVHLQACSACEQELAELRATVAAIHSLPLKEAPRSFVLAPEQVGSASSLAPVSRLGLPMRLGAAGLAFALSLVLVVDIADLGGGGVETAPAELATTTDTDSAEEMFEAAPPSETEPLPSPAEPRAAGDEPGAADEGDAEAAAPPAPEAQDGPEATDAPEAEGELGAAEGPEMVPVPSEDGGLDSLRIAEIALAAALGASILIAAAVALRARRSG